ncbi:ABC-2 family transporter protein [Posidoniimonas polymericola]|uniref:ABC-2 family transporter protein n=1 Tax=Posidoniimonas polymericola TaxID=2528002 RepID=A0A5C5YM16_9BACT|nr:ABC transporter permease subunit/CPBP intramembrane protease [Posidoniimonas polymericola]TWT75880.1 ABC-2 family transporter protein [Posidoniimonas polymericola]
MNWRNIQLVWSREIRDQLRDRRTLFMVAVLPLFMYPLLGASFFQLSQFLKQHKATVAVVGSEQLDEVEGVPPLIVDGAFAADLFLDPQQARLLDVQTIASDSPEAEIGQLQRRLKAGTIDAIVQFPDDFAESLGRVREQSKHLPEGEATQDSRVSTIPVLSNTAREASQVAQLRVDRVLGSWIERVVRRNLADGNVPESITRPIQIVSSDVADESQKRAGVWAKLLPFVVFVWALTGAFYPAVDLCAGEKERGTLETLLSSPAQRGEIVWGKLLTVICFSMATSLLNLASLGATGQFLLGQITNAAGGDAGLGMPPITSLLWLIVALPPVAALFSALSIACASFAKSTKEGQYYFMPLFMGVMPLMMFPMSPGVELNFGNSLVPLMGVVLLLRSLIEGQYLEALRYAVPVAVVTLLCCMLAVRWAVHQFNQESVLFREGEQFSVGQWLKKLVREPQPVATAGMAMACIGFVFLLKFFAEMAVAGYAASAQPGVSLFAVMVLISQACILAPAVLMALVLVKRKSAALFGARRPTLLAMGSAFVLALLAQPVGMELGALIQRVYPPSEELLSQTGWMQEIMLQTPVWALMLMIGVLPALCEELTFRGFVMGGLRSSLPSSWAVLISAVAFGAAHTILQQSISAGILGVLLGYLAFRWGSVWPGVAFHATYNSLMVLFTSSVPWISDWVQKTGWRGVFQLDDKGQVSGYHGAVVALAAVGLCAMLVFFEQTRPRAATMADPAQ